jgi:hypothetical protein
LPDGERYEGDSKMTNLMAKVSILGLMEHATRVIGKMAKEHGKGIFTWPDGNATRVISKMANLMAKVSILGLMENATRVIQRWQI